MKVFQKQRWLAIALAAMWVSSLLVPGTVKVASAAGVGGLVPLNTIPVPLPTNIGSFVANQAAAIQLGKALFWDMQAGSDGVQACASCHFQAGADVRFNNTLNPGANGVFDILGPGQTLTTTVYPIKAGDVVGSQGVINANFVSLSGTAVDNLTVVPDPVFNVNGVNVRRCTGRNAPFAVNAVFNFRSFWDGRANNSFNGVNPSGPLGVDQPVVFQVIGGVPTPVTVNITNASLASQSCGPPLSPVEMSGAGRTFPQLGSKLLGLPPLAQQQVAPTDSVLGGLSASPGNGLTTNYTAMIKAAFLPEWTTNPAGDGAIVANGFTLLELNFSLFWGLAIDLYEATLVSDQTPLDQFLAGNTAALTANQQAGLQVYIGQGRCNQCHSGGELSKASVSQTGGNPTTGFFNTGVRPVAEDGGDILQPGQGKFKTPGLRNILLTGPYFHNGDKATLREVVDFYDRGGDFPNAFTDSQIRPLGLTNDQKDALVDLMANGMTDQRVLFERAPFDHPSLNLANGANLAAVGAGGRATPLQPFLGLNPFFTLNRPVGAYQLLVN